MQPTLYSVIPFFFWCFLCSDDSAANCQSGLAYARPPVRMCVEHRGDLMEQGNENQKAKSSLCDFEKSLSLFKQELSEVDSFSFVVCRKIRVYVNQHFHLLHSYTGLENPITSLFLSTVSFKHLFFFSFFFPFSFQFSCRE